MQDQKHKALAAELKNNMSRLMDRRSNWETHWQEVADLVIPRKSDIVDEKVRGDKSLLAYQTRFQFNHASTSRPLIYTF